MSIISQKFGSIHNSQILLHFHRYQCTFFLKIQYTFYLLFFIRLLGGCTLKMKWPKQDNYQFRGPIPIGLGFPFGLFSFAHPYCNCGLQSHTRKRNRQAESFWATYTQKSKVAFFCSLEIFFSMFGLGVNLVEGKKLNYFCNQIKTYSTITVSFVSLTQQSKCQDLCTRNDIALTSLSTGCGFDSHIKWMAEIFIFLSNI